MKSFRSASIRVIALVVICAVFFLQPFHPAIAAAADGNAMQGIIEKVDIKNGSFSVSVSTNVPAVPDGKPLRVGRALVSLSPDTLKQGTVDSIKITGPDGVEFSCVNLKVKQGTDLITSCGGPALLVAGTTTYEARGSNFGPEQNGSFAIDLLP